MNVLEATNLRIGYHDDLTGMKQIVCEISFNVREGEIVGITGVSGSGKTTLLNAIAGLISLAGGEVHWQKGRAKSVTYCPQHDVLLGYRTNWENAVLLLESHRINWNQNRHRLDFVERALKLTQLADERDRMPNQLSGGMRQRLQVIQALAAPGDLTMLDEPFAQQDRDRLRVMEDLSWSEMREARRAALIVSHDVDTLAAICDRVIFLGGSPAKDIVTVKTPSSLIALGGTARRNRSEFLDFNASLWRERAKAAMV